MLYFIRTSIIILVKEFFICFCSSYSPDPINVHSNDKTETVPEKGNYYTM